MTVRAEGNPSRQNDVRQRALRALQNALKVSSPGTDLDAKGYTNSFADNLVPSVAIADFEADLRQGSGDELAGKFRAAHSSTALAVNCFRPFRRSLSHLRLCGTDGFRSLHFEKKCPTGLRGIPPNLDVLAGRANRVVAIESKCTEYLSRPTARFHQSYKTGIRDARRRSSWYQEMLRLIEAPKAYGWLDAAQLIKHAFGLMRCYTDRHLTLLYLYWEPLNAIDYPLFGEHRREIAAFAKQIAAPRLAFEALTYCDLWSSWNETAPQWLRSHLRDLTNRYAISI